MHLHAREEKSAREKKAGVDLQCIYASINKYDKVHDVYVACT